MSALKDYLARIEGICGGETDVIVSFRCDEKDRVIANILKRGSVKKAASGFMFEVEFQGVTFRLFTSGRAVFRGVKNRKQLNRILKALLL